MSNTEIATVNQVSDFLLHECRERGELLTNLKLQKLLYYAQAWHLVYHGKQIFEEDFQAWVHGPVAPSQYQRFKKFGWQPILEEIKRPELGGLESFLCNIIDNFGIETATALELMTHNERPWIDARGGIPPDENCSNIIKKAAMKTYYESMISE